MSRRIMLVSVVSMLACASAMAEPITFTLMTWTNDTVSLPTAVGLKPSFNNTNEGANTTQESDWLVFTDDDKDTPTNAPYNFWGSLSHKFNDRVGLSGESKGGFESCNSLTGSITMAFAEAGQDAWAVELKDYFTLGNKTAATTSYSRSYLVTTNFLEIVTNEMYGLDGLGNTGMWVSTGAGNWALSFSADSFADTMGGVRHTEVYADCRGFIIPVAELTTAGMAQTTLVTPTGFYTNDFERYLMREITPRLPADAKYLLFVQFLKTHLKYSSNPNHVETDKTLFGESWFATTTQEMVPEPGMAAIAVVIGCLVRFGRSRQRR